MAESYLDGIKIQSYAKLNLSLEIKGIEFDEESKTNKHLLETWFQAINFYDELEFFQNEGQGFEISLDNKNSENSNLENNIESDIEGVKFPLDQSNLIYKAGEILGVLDFKVKVHKNIPLQGGLAGGSGNGAATLVALNQLYDLKYSDAQLLDFAAKLGADVKFSLETILGGLPYQSFGTRFGDVLDNKIPETLIEQLGTKLGDLDDLDYLGDPNLKLILLTFKQGLSTPLIYQTYDEISSAADRHSGQEAEANSQPQLTNDLTPAIEHVWKQSSMPDLKSIYYLLDQFSSYYAFTGSGPTIFAFIADDKSKNMGGGSAKKNNRGSVGENFEKYLENRSELESLCDKIIEIDNPFI